MQSNRATSYLALFGSSATLICCALPALLITLGLGASVAALTTKVPQLIWLSEHKDLVFAMSGMILILAIFAHWRARNTSCPVDHPAKGACLETKDWGRWVLYASIFFYLTGVFFVYLWIWLS